MLSWESLHSIVVGSVASHVTELAAGLAGRGHEVHVFTRMGPDQARHEQIGGVYYHRCPVDRDEDFVEEIGNMCNSLAWHLGEAEYFLGSGGFDVVHGHDWLCAGAIVQAKNRHHKPVVMTLHSTEYGRCGNVHCGGRSDRISHLEWEGTYVANRVICVSEALAREAQGLYEFPVEKTSCVHNGVRASRYDGPVDRASVRAAYGIGPEDPLILYVGRMAWQKGPDILVNTIPGLVEHRPEAKFVFVGDGDMLPGLRERVADMGVADATRLLGHVNGQTLIDLFKSSDVLCVPSRNEPFGVVILEAWSASQPVVATRSGAPPEFVRHGYDGLVVGDEADSVGWGVGAIFEDIERARWMGRNGRSQVQSRFTWDKVAAQTERVYEDALAG
jgi:glycosyltransferase involved in cell wall biosynthesis